jgi:hypothetical protein
MSAHIFDIAPSMCGFHATISMRIASELSTVDFTAPTVAENS